MNYYNAMDYALGSGTFTWELDQKLKPNGNLDYDYDSGTNTFTHATSTVLAFPVDTYELFSFCVEARSFALGKQANIAGPFATALQIDLNVAPFNFGSAHKGHSAQFRSYAALRAPYWGQLLTSYGINTTP